MTGFKNFILKGNLVELAVAFVMAVSFAAVVTSMVAVIMDVVGKVIGEPDFSSWTPLGISIGAFLTALLSFLIMGAVVYFGIVKPYTAAQEKFFPKAEEDAGTPEDVLLLEEIRDLLRAQGGRSDAPRL